MIPTFKRLIFVYYFKIKYILLRRKNVPSNIFIRVNLNVVVLFNEVNNIDFFEYVRNVRCTYDLSIMYSYCRL